jgi:TolB-like protein
MSTTNLPSKTEINNQVEKICTGEEFITKLQLCKLLKYLINETLEGREDKLKGFTIAVEVFNKDHHFDPDQDPLVRIHAGRLRRMLKMYYLETGKNDSIKIDIPKGRYIPFFSFNNQSLDEQISIPITQNNSTLGPTVVVLPFKNHATNTDKDYFVLGIAEELSVELTKFEELTIFESTPFANQNISEAEKNEFIKNKGIRFIIDGGVHWVDNKIKLLVKLTDTLKGEQIWADRYTVELTTENIIEVQERISSEVSCILGSEYGIILQRLSLESKRVKPTDIDTFDAILKFHYYEANQTPETATIAFVALQEALKRESYSGIATAMLACMHCNQYLLDVSDAEYSHEQLSILSEKAFKLDPYSLTVRIILAIKYFINNEKDRFLNEAEKCLSMNPNSPFWLGNLGQYISLYGDWEQGKRILDRVMQMNVSFPLYLFGITSVYYYRKKEYNKALIEANQYNMPALFWGPMLRAAALGQLNKLSEAEANIAHLKQLKPNFEEEARYLISRFIKEEELIEHVIEGLKKAGMIL